MIRIIMHVLNIIDRLVGHGEYLSALQMSVRAAIIFFVLLFLIRVGGVRIFGRRSGFDLVIVITMGSVLARGIVGASPFLATIAASAAMIVIHRLLGWLSSKNRRFEKIIKGDHLVLYDKDRIIMENLEKSSLSREDLEESLRLETKSSSLEKVETAYLETNGRISFILKKE
ncbi:MAG TPA: YetF domain-containing protein [Chitinophagaceae bacterium]|nr:YetF domain-containing protein [Chitinophagaceae bacterium]